MCALFAVGTIVTSASAAAPQRPDLVSEAPSGAVFDESHASDAQPRLLLRFNAFIHNAGPGPLELRIPIDATGPGGRDELAGAVAQRIEADDGSVAETPLPRAEAVFEDRALSNEDGHDHWHLQRAARYDLIAADGTGAPVAAAKVGFCMLDSVRAQAPASVPPRYGATSDCRRPAATPAGAAQILMGISPGWMDLYDRRLAHQYVDVSAVPPGTYRLRAQVDPDDVVEEADEENPPAATAVPVRIPGYLARARVAADTVLLDAARVEPSRGTLGAPLYRIEQAPRHGTIDKPVGAWFSDPLVRFTPANAAAPQPDELEYVVRAADSAFPTVPPRATVALGGADRVAIAGAPATLVRDTSVQLAATGPAGQPLTWSVTGGAITADGRLTAPAATGAVTVRAAAAAGAADAVTIAIVDPPAQLPAPQPRDAPAGDPAVVPPAPLAPAVPGRPGATVAAGLAVLPRAAIASAVAERSGRYVTVGVVPGRSGRLRVVLRRGTRTLAACAVKAVSGRAVTCRLRRPRAGRGALRVVVVLGQTVRTVAIRPAHVN